MTPRQVEERVAAHLVDRKFLEPDDLKIALGQKGEPAGAEPFLARCASNRLITAGQSRRIREELPELMRTVVPGYVLEKKNRTWQHFCCLSRHTDVSQQACRLEDP